MTSGRLRRYTTQFSLWCIAKAVLLLGCDLSAPLIANGTAADFYEIVSRAHDIAGIWVASLAIWVAFFSRRQLAALSFLLNCPDVLEFYSSDTMWVVAH